jgi:hypothetical protein
LASRRILRGRNFGSYVAALNQDISLLSTRPNATSIAGNVIGSSALDPNISLDNNTLQSGNYVPGHYGWKIDSNGLAEFGNVYVRGDINARTGTIGYWHISTPTVERTIGNRQLFGTFLESNDIGYSDNDKVSGSYVSLFKSYDEPAVSITNKYRINNVATITAPEHGFENADFVTINVEDDIGFSTGESSIQIFGVTRDTFSYVNAGDDFLNEDSTGLELDTSASGTAQLYIKDVSGLYLQDYGKTLFDYGYFSNEGVAYASAETFNLVHNPSFELEVNGIPTANVAGWTVANSSAVTISSVAFNDEASPVDGMYRAVSDYGLNVVWTSVPSNGNVLATTNYEIVNDLVLDDPTLYLHADIFAAPFHEAASVQVNGYVANSSTVVVTTATAHGLTTGDYIYETFLVPATSDSIVTVPGGGSYVMRVSNVVSNTVFHVNNVFKAGTSPVVTSDRPSVVVAKVDVPEFRISQVKVDFGNSSTPILLTEIMTDGWLAKYALNPYNGKLSLSESELNSSIRNDFENNQILAVNTPALGIIHRPTSSDAHRVDLELEISLSKLYNAYRQKNPTGLVNKNAFKMIFPAKLYILPTGAEDTSGSYVLDNISLSTEKRFFYAESSLLSYSWYSEEDKPNTPSVQSTKQWLDIDLTNQTANYKYTDSLQFKSPSFSNDLTINSGVYTVNTLENEEILWQGLHSDTTSSNLFVSSGAYTRTSEITDNSEITMQSYALSIVSQSHTSYQISSDLSYANAATGEYIRTHAASIALDSYEDETIDDDGYKRDRGSQIWASADNIIFSTRNDIIGSDKNLKFKIYGNTDIIGNLKVISGTATVPIVNAGSEDDHAATVKFVKDNRQAYYLPTSNVSEATYANSKRIYISNTAPNAGTLGDIWVRI